MEVDLDPSPCRLAVVGALADLDDDFLTRGHGWAEARPRGLRALAKLAGDAEALPRTSTVGAVVPYLWRSAVGERRLLSVHRVVVAAVSDDLVVVSVGEARNPRSDRYVVPAPNRPGEDQEASHGEAIEPVAKRLEQFAANRSLQGQDGTRGADEIAAAVARYLAESATRASLEDVLRVDLRDIEAFAVHTARMADDRAAHDDPVSAALKEARTIPAAVQGLRAAVGGVTGELQRSERERLEAWRFGTVRHPDLDPATAATLSGPAADLARAHAHVAAAVRDALALRSEAVDALATLNAVTHGLEARLAESTRDAADAFQVSIAALTAALAGPGLLFALWALDVWAQPRWAAAVAGGAALVLLIAIWWFLRSKSPAGRLAGKEVGAAALLVGALMAAGVFLPEAVSDGGADEEIQELLERHEKELDRIATGVEDLQGRP